MKKSEARKILKNGHLVSDGAGFFGLYGDTVMVHYSEETSYEIGDFDEFWDKHGDEIEDHGHFASSAFGQKWMSDGAWASRRGLLFSQVHPKSYRPHPPTVP